MYRKRKEKRKKIIIISSIIFIIVLFVLLNIFIPNSFKIVSNFTKDRLLNIENVFTKQTLKIKNKIENNNRTDEYFNQVDNMLEEYQLIKDENEELKKEIESLNEQLDIKTNLSDKEIINCTVINRNIEYWYNDLTIDKGTNDNIKEGMAVLYKGYLIGKIDSASPSNATVRLLTNINNKISVKITVDKKDIYGLLVSYKDSKYIVEGISDNTEIPLDSVVKTTGLSNTFPSGITIGKVSKVTTDNFDLSRILEVTPSIDMNDIDYVSVVGVK